MGLDDYYLQLARSQILILKPVPTVNQAYIMIFSNENRKSIITTAEILDIDPANSQGSFDVVMYSRSSGQRSKKGYNLVLSRSKGILEKYISRLLGTHKILNSKRKKVKIMRTM